MASGANRGGSFSEINITPLTDVFLVLLVVIMIVAPVADRRSDITTPAMTQSNAISDSWPVVEIGATGIVYFGGAEVGLDQLGSLLSAKMSESDTKAVVVRGDKAAQSGRVMEILKIAGDSGCEQAYIAGELQPPVAVGQEQNPVEPGVTVGG